MSERFDRILQRLPPFLRSAAQDGSILYALLWTLATELDELEAKLLSSSKGEPDLLASKHVFTRQLVELKEGEEQPKYALQLPPPVGYRYETDVEFRIRIHEELDHE